MTDTPRNQLSLYLNVTARKYLDEQATENGLSRSAYISYLLHQVERRKASKGSDAGADA